jgi:hypothetical protein
MGQLEFFRVSERLNNIGLASSNYLNRFNVHVRVANVRETWTAEKVGLAYQVCFSNATSLGASGRRLVSVAGFETHSHRPAEAKALLNRPMFAREIRSH